MNVSLKYLSTSFHENPVDFFCRLIKYKTSKMFGLSLFPVLACRVAKVVHKMVLIKKCIFHFHVSSLTTMAYATHVCFNGYTKD